jgi:uncharacterized protein (TIGR01777 family)
MKILITGGTGFLGSSLCKYFCQKGEEVTILTRQQKLNTLKAGSPYFISDLKANEKQYDVIINLAGEPLDKHRWNAKVKKELYESRIKTTQTLIDYIRDSEKKPALLLSGSAIGFYGNHDSKIFTESSEADNGDFSQTLCQDWENTALQASHFGLRVCLLRTSLVLGNKGVALKKMLPAFKAGLGAVIGSGRQWMSWIHINDWVCAIDFLIQQTNLSGPVNLSSPHPVSNTEFTDLLAQTLHRPRFLSLKPCVMKMLFGEMAESLLLNGAKVLPDKLLKAGYVFQFDQLEKAFEAILKKARNDS